jgi:hypothetical protein
MVGGYSTQKDWILTMPGGVACTNHDMPVMPQPVRAFAVAQAYRRWIYICGGSQFGGDKEPPISCKFLNVSKMTFTYIEMDIDFFLRS